MARRMIEKRRRGFFGWIFLLLFWAWNALMVAWLFTGVGATNCTQYASDAARSGCAAGTGVAMIAILLVWALGAVILGMLAFFARGRRELIEVESN